MAVTGDADAGLLEPALEPPLEVTRTGPAAAWADASALEREGIRLVEARTAVVLVIVDGRVPPTRADVALVEAVSGATGRCAVGLDLDLDREPGSGSGPASDSGVSPGVDAMPGPNPSRDAGYLDRWRDAVHVDVVVGPIDATMARTLKLLATGPARPITPTPGQRRRALLGAQLAADRAGRARAVDKRMREMRAAVPHAIADSLEAVARRAGGHAPAELDRAVERAAGRVADALDLPRAPDCPSAPDPPRGGGLMEAGVGVLTLGAALGAGGLLGAPLRWAGLPGWAVGAITVVAGVALALALAIGARRRRIERELAAWVAAHLAKVRRGWDREIAAMLRDEARPPPDGWRARHLAGALRAETGG